MKIKNKLRMYGDDWRVIKDRNLSLTDGLWGQTRHRTHEILLEVGHEGIEKTFLHEIIHVIDTCETLGLGEDEIARLTHGIYTIIRDNKLNFLED